MPTGKKHTLETYLLQLFKKHPENEKKYGYEKTVYVNYVTKIIITCHKHGDFEQTPKDHLSGRGCHKCFIEKQTKTHQQFLEEAQEIHPDKFVYLSVYVNKKTKIQIQCKICKHIFEQTPKDHLSGHGCPKCALRASATKNNKNSMIIQDINTGFYINNAVWNKYKKNAKKRNLNFDITPEDILELYKKQNGLCAFTGAKLICNSIRGDKNNWSIDRLNSNKGYTIDNIVLDTKTVNMYRNRSTPTEFLEICNMVASVKNATGKYSVMSPEEKAAKLENHSIRFSKKKD